MAVNIANTNNTNTFEYWRLRTNNMANAFRTKAVTTSSNTTSGSAAITGTFSGGNLKANGTTQSTSTTTGALQSKGGLGVSRNAHIGGKLVVTGISNTANVNVAGTVSATLFSGNGSSLTSVDAETLDGKDSTDFTSNTFALSTFATNNYIEGRFTSNTYIESRNLTSNNYVTSQVGLRATNTYVNSTFASNNYLDGRFTSNAYAAASFTSNSFLTASFLRSDVADTADAKITLTTGIELASTGDANLSVGTVNLPNTANLKIDGMESATNKFLRVSGDGSKFVFSNSTIANTGDIGDIQINYGSISNADVLVFDEATSKFVNRPRSLIDITSVDDIDDVNITQSRGELLVRVVNTSNSSTFANTSNGFITGRMDSMSETELTGLTSNTVSFTSSSNSYVQVFVNGVRLGNADYTTTTSQVKLTDALVSSDVISIVEFDPHAFVVGDGTASEINQLNYSDINLKENIEPYEASSSIFDVETYTYYWKDKFRFHDRQEVGFVAQNIEDYVPQVVSTNSQGEKMVDYGKMTAVLLSTIQQMNKRIEALEQNHCHDHCDCECSCSEE